MQQAHGIYKRRAKVLISAIVFLIKVCILANESAPKPPQAICKPLCTLESNKKNMNIKTISVIITIFICTILGGISIGISKEYGWTVFLIIPFLIGYLPPFIVGRKQEIKRNESYGLSFLTLGIVLIGLLVFAIEGIICIAMALPI
ncbi:MAG: hypothetical protein LRY27_04110 [Chitinophagales bacterium]|nr:hypothetical protein [Chitinophagales bacterium]